MELLFNYTARTHLRTYSSPLSFPRWGVRRPKLPSRRGYSTLSPLYARRRDRKRSAARFVTPSFFFSFNFPLVEARVRHICVRLYDVTENSAIRD